MKTTVRKAQHLRSPLEEVQAYLTDPASPPTIIATADSATLTSRGPSFNRLFKGSHLTETYHLIREGSGTRVEAEYTFESPGLKGLAVRPVLQAVAVASRLSGSDERATRSMDRSIAEARRGKQQEAITDVQAL
jgi:hypothetical protein